MDEVEEHLKKKPVIIYYDMFDSVTGEGRSYSIHGTDETDMRSAVESFRSMNPKLPAYEDWHLKVEKPSDISGEK